MEQKTADELYKDLINLEEQYYELCRQFNILYYSLKYIDNENIHDMEAVCAYADIIFEKLRQNEII